ncbi:MAG TPA: terminase family protein [Gemmatimonadaceae bacterium]|nr:terminase family protein [Gemmatimonadaceae bacterium]
MSATASPAASLASLPATERAAILADLSDDELLALEYDWRFWARPNQLAPGGDWTTWLLLAGRGFGKTRSGAEFINEQVRARRAKRIALVAATAPDARDVMVEGESGLLTISPPWFRPLYEPSKRRLTWPNGARATLYSADEPDRLRGPQHDIAWCDELAAWRFPEAFDMLMLGLRLGERPRVCVTTTPKPTLLIRDLLKDPTVSVTHGSTYENRVNLAPAFIHTVVRKYEGTRLGRQELLAELLEDVEGALWTLGLIEEHRMSIETFGATPLSRIVVAIDPNVSSGPDADDAGVVVAGIGAGTCPCGKEQCGYVLDDRSGAIPPIEWARRAIQAYKDHKADRVVAETNNGGELVETQLRVVDATVSYRAVHAARGKITRAEPVQALYEQGRVHHVGGFPELEDQLTQWVPGAGMPSPGRLDALVWALTDLMLQSDDGFIAYYREQAQALAAQKEKLHART